MRDISGRTTPPLGISSGLWWQLVARLPDLKQSEFTEDPGAATMILSSVDPSANYVSLIAGLTDCSATAFTGTAPSAAIAASDRFPQGPYPSAGTTKTTLQGGYGNLKRSAAKL
ncbi:hypothetical protein B0H19DRAFT_1234152 [Mycena capillaripes]|nr:hypothetical protein B0H19DRAFT_1234152 [Mycena capillaripes]